MEIYKLLEKLAALGISIKYDGNQFKLLAPKNKLTPELKKIVLDHKPEIIALLEGKHIARPEEHIPKLFPTEKYELSFAQERLWFLYQFDKTSTAYNISTAIEIKGKLEIDKFHDSFNNVLWRHEVLRSRFLDIDGVPYASICAVDRFNIILSDISEASDHKKESLLKAALIAESEHCFNFEDELLLRAKLVRFSVNHHILILTIHHIIFDGWSSQLFLTEFLHYYNKANQLEPLRIGYYDYAGWQKQNSAKSFDKQIAFWKEKLRDYSNLDLLFDYPKTDIASNNLGVYKFTINNSIFSSLKKIAQEENATTYMILLSVFTLLIYKYTQSHDFCIGSPVANRSDPDLEQLIGLFVNTIVLRMKFDPERTTFQQLLKFVRETCLNVYENQDVPFEMVVDELNVPRDLSTSPIFQVMFNYDSNRYEEIPEVDELEFKFLTVDSTTTQFDFSVDFCEISGNLQGIIEYADDLFNEDTIQNFVHYFNLLSQQIINNPEKFIYQFSLLSEDEEKKVYALSNGPCKDYMKPLLIHERVEQITHFKPKNVAAVDGNDYISYEDLNNKANQIANFLSLQKCARAIVGVYLKRSVDYLCVILGVIKSGAGFLSLDVNEPLERHSYVIGNSAIELIVTDKCLGRALSEQDEVTVVCIEDIIGDDIYSFQPYQAKVIPDSIAYLVYTSGSTGKPKGVPVTHRAALNHIDAQYDVLCLDDQTNFLQSAPLSADISIWQFLAPLLYGGTTVILREPTDVASLTREVNEHAVSLVELVPVLLESLLEHVENTTDKNNLFKSLKWMMVTGEQVSKKLVNRWLTYFPHIPIANAYGPAEGGDDVCQALVREKLLSKDRMYVPIGRPLPNLSVVLLDEYQQLIPAGLKGEIYISGVGVSVGYWRDDERSVSNFIPNPFKKLYGTTLYRTGDFGRWRKDRYLEFIGRNDEQVKVRGHRVELKEIEAVLMELPVIEMASVILKNQDKINILVGYVNSIYNKKIDLNAVQKQLTLKLPSYMVPSQIHQIEKFPLLTGGKINKKALSTLSIETPKESRSVTTATERQLIDIWEELFQNQVLTVDSNFFFVGGYSLLAIKLINRISHCFDLELPVQKIFEKPTIADLADYLDELMNNNSENKHEDTLLKNRIEYELSQLDESQIERLLENLK